VAKIGDVTVTIRAIDEVSPVIRRIKWHLWIWRYSDRIILAMGVVILVLAVVLAFVLGRVTA